MSLQLPAYAAKLFDSKRYKALYGGRGSAKSYTVARILLALGANKPIRVLCGREFQNSLNESVYKLLLEQANEIGLGAFYGDSRGGIQGANGTEFIFKGVRMNVASIKSMVGLTHLWLEEAHTISQASWDILIPTIREPESEIWVTFNPDREDDPTYTMFVNSDGTPKKRDDAIILNVNWHQNPWFPDVLKREKDYLYRVNPELADHVWGGRVRTSSSAQIFRDKYRVEQFEPKSHWDGPYFGADWGFSSDPTVLTKCYLDTVNREIYVRNARFGFHIELDYLADLFDQIKESRSHIIRADSARPETISYLSRKGFRIESVAKWKGSVEDGVEWLRNWKTIVIHPDCEQQFNKDGLMTTYGMVTEAKNYSYKVDRLTGDVRTEIVDAFNHGWDAIRYAFEPLITKQTSILDVI